jgi:hypothetical protein
MENFERGDRVVVTDSSLKSYGKEGEVTHVYAFEPLLDVKLDVGGSLRISQSKVTKVVDKNITPDSSGQAIYFLYGHDYPGRYPKNFKDACDNFIDVCSPLIVTDNLEELKEEIRDNITTWLNFVVIANNKVYPVQTEPTCPGLF